jgi:hypothetical protein
MNNNKQQTAVEWLVNALDALEKQMEVAPKTTNYKSTRDSCINQAKELEKQQIIDACQQGFYDGIDVAKTKKSKFKSAQEYYNETFNK